MTQSLLEVFQKYEVTEIEKVFHNFQINDTLVYNDDSLLVKIPDLSRVYKLIFAYERSVDSLIEELNQWGQRGSGLES
jgi:hypothetical protein